MNGWLLLGLAAMFLSGLLIGGFVMAVLTVAAMDDHREGTE